MSGAKHRTAAAQQPPVGTAQVERRTLSAMVSQAGTLTYRARSDGSPYSVINQARGTYTKLPAAGQVISQGHVLYRVNDRPVVLLHGSTPAYRTLSAGASGPDVAELNADLVALGYATRAQLSPRSASFGPATTTAVDEAPGRPGGDPERHAGSWPGGVRTHRRAGDERVSPARGQRPARRDGDAGHLDHSPGAGGVERLATDHDGGRGQGEHHPAQQPDHPGCRLLGGDGRHLPVELRVGRVGIELRRAGNGHLLLGRLGEQPRRPSPWASPRLDPAATGTWDQAPVQVGITTASVPNALVVPVTALLAQSGGGYAVEVVGAGARNHLVPVSLGLFDDAEGLVQVTGSGLAAGQEVVVPST